MIRVTGGFARGRVLRVPRGLQTRPTQARLREALFSSIHPQLPETRVLDLFSGSGAIGIEALSRGVSNVTFVEKNFRACQAIRFNLAELGFSDRAFLIRGMVEKNYKRVQEQGPFDFIFADPPYQLNWDRIQKNWNWAELLTPEGKLFLEGSRRKPSGHFADLVKSQEKFYGDTVLIVYKRMAHA